MKPTIFEAEGAVRPSRASLRAADVMRPGLGRCPRLAHRDDKTTAVYAADAPSPHERRSSEGHLGHQG